MGNTNNPNFDSNNQTYAQHRHQQQQQQQQQQMQMQGGGGGGGGGVGNLNLYQPNLNNQNHFQPFSNQQQPIVLTPSMLNPNQFNAADGSHTMAANNNNVRTPSASQSRDNSASTGTGALEASAMNFGGLTQSQIQMLQHQQYLAKQQQKQKQEILNIFTGEPMEICWVFWKDNVDILPRNKQKELALLLYSHMFQKIATARRLFVKGEIDKQALRFLDMFGFLIRQLKDPDQGSLISTLQGLGRRHAAWGVRMEYFQPMMLSLHAALSDHFKHTYTVRVKFCMEQLFTSAANVMTGQDLYAIFSVRYATVKSLSFLSSLDACLADEIGSEYLERFLTQSFCSELVAFHAIYKKYRGALSDHERYAVGTKIVRNFLTPNGVTELNLKNVEMRDEIVRRLQKHEKKSKNGKAVVMPLDLFDPIFEWVMEQIRENTWPKFKSTISSISMAASTQK